MMETLVGISLTTAISAVGFIFHLAARVAVLESQHDNLNARLDRIENKLDQLLGRKELA